MAMCTEHCSTGDKHPKMKEIDSYSHKRLYLI